MRCPARFERLVGGLHRANAEPLLRQVSRARADVDDPENLGRIRARRAGGAGRRDLALGLPCAPYAGPEPGPLRGAAGRRRGLDRVRGRRSVAADLGRRLVGRRRAPQDEEGSHAAPGDQDAAERQRPDDRPGRRRQRPRWSRTATAPTRSRSRPRRPGRDRGDRQGGGGRAPDRAGRRRAASAGLRRRPAAATSTSSSPSSTPTPTRRDAGLASPSRPRRRCRRLPPPTPPCCRRRSRPGRGAMASSQAWPVTAFADSLAGEIDAAMIANGPVLKGTPLRTGRGRTAGCCSSPSHAACSATSQRHADRHRAPPRTTETATTATSFDLDRYRRRSDGA